MRRAVIALTVLLAVSAAVEAPAPRHDVELGVTFSPRYARWLGLDARAVYIDMLDRLGVRHVRLPIYWDEVEAMRGIYDFTEMDFYLSQAEARGVRTVLSLGYKQPRWPECYEPDWTARLGPSALRARILRLVEAEVTHARQWRSVVMWQVENEPFVDFGRCRPDVLTPTFVNEEVELVQRLDARPALITDSGENSTWIMALSAPRTRFGLSLYRDIPLPLVGVVRSPAPAWAYAAKDWVARLLAGADGTTIITELQSEAWFESTDGLDVARELHRARFPAHAMLTDNVAFARRTGFSQAYLWGVEWWYWMAAHGHAEYLRTAQLTFAEARPASRPPGSASGS